MPERLERVDIEGVFAKTLEDMGITISWSHCTKGFGEILIHQGDWGNIIIDAENMSKDFVKEVLLFMVDNATFKE